MIVYWLQMRCERGKSKFKFNKAGYSAIQLRTVGQEQ